MNQENNNEQLTNITPVDKSCDALRLPKPWAVILMVVAVVFVIRLAWGQAAPTLTITPMGTNGYSIILARPVLMYRARPFLPALTIRGRGRQLARRAKPIFS